MSENEKPAERGRLRSIRGDSRPAFAPKIPVASSVPVAAPEPAQRKQRENKGTRGRGRGGRGAGRSRSDRPKFDKNKIVEIKPEPEAAMPPAEIEISNKNEFSSN